MRRLRAVLVLGAFAGSALGAGFEWQPATPESQGLSSAKLEALRKRMASKGTAALLIIRNDRIVCEWYAAGLTAANRHGTASLAKAIGGGLSLAVAITDGRIALDDPVAKFVPQWRDDPRKSKITIRQLGSHTSGMEDAEADGLPHDQLSGWKGDFWKRLDPPRDPFTLARDVTPLLFDPGDKLQYSNPGIGMLTYCITATLRGDEHQDIRTLLRERVMRPIGVPDAEWSVGYGRTFTVDGLPLVGAWGGGSYTPRAVARIGRLMLRKGDWDGRRILSPDAVRAVTGDAGLPGHCGMGWWSNGGGRYTRLPQDAVYGAGAGDQVLLLVPSLSLILVRNGQTLEAGPDEPPVGQEDVFTQYHDYRARILFEPLVEAVLDGPKETGAAPYPPSPFIEAIKWAPKETIIRRAKGSDNWPLTWADDDALYAAYGDGNGFEPFTPEKLSLGFARITGQPPDFTTQNVRSPTGEARGDGPSGRKASGLLSVEGVLYLWSRNVGNAQLGWSSNHGASWAWADWKITNSFGCPTFLNFGRDHASARDDFVYVYSPDADSAYEAADRLVLARVPKAKVRDRGAYEFFARLDDEGKPVWSCDLVELGGVFTHTGHCRRVSVSYNAGLQRYLLVQPVAGPASRYRGGRVDTRFTGGLAVYAAPEPWGAWTTAFFTNQWDVGPGETASFPPKWMSADGRTLHLVFSGDDAFSVRQATVVRSNLTSTVDPPDIGLDFIDTSFENASPLWYEIDPDGTVQIHLIYDHERASPNRAAGHWHFLLQGRPGAKLTLVLNNLNNVWNGQPGSIAREASVTMVSTNGRDWRPVPIRQVPVGRLQMELELPGPRLYVARVEPYRLSDLNNLLASIRTHPGVEITPVGKTAEGRVLEIVRVGDPSAPFRVFIRARAHPWEAGGNWVVEGLIHRLLLEDAEANRFRARYCVYVMPMANKDGVARGRTRFNLQGKDLNRDWDRPADAELTPENHALETWLEAMIEKGQRPHLALELHNDGGGKLHLSRPPVPGLERHVARLELFERLLRKHTWFTEGATPPSFHNTGTLGDGWVTRYGVDAVVHEFNASWIAGLKDYPSARHWRGYGAQLCRVLDEYFDTEKTSAGVVLKPFFQAPAEFAGQLGSYRSPLLFNDGRPVRSAAGWPRRRAEIFEQWHELMGPWPPVIEQPKLEVLCVTNRNNFTQKRVRLEIAPRQTGEGWLLEPAGSGPFPAVLVVYYEPETGVGLNPKQRGRDFGLQLTRRGFVTLSIGTPGGNAWQPEVGTAQCQPLSFHAYVAANCWHALANLSEVDPARVGVVGHSYGGKWAMFAAALWDKFACAAVSDPGIVFDESRPNVNYWEPWYLGFDPQEKRPKPGVPSADNPRTGAYRRMIESGRDLHELHALIAPRPFLVSGGAEDSPARWVALNHTVAVNRLLGFTNRVALSSRAGHDPTEESNEQLYAFFEYFLQAQQP